MVRLRLARGVVRGAVVRRALVRAVVPRSEIAQANQDICGTQKIEGAPHLKDEHLEVFDCANKCGKDGERFIHYMGHVRMKGVEGRASFGSAAGRNKLSSLSVARA